MQRISSLFHQRDRDDFSSGDHQEYVESGARDIFLVGGIGVLFIALFIVSLF